MVRDWFYGQQRPVQHLLSRTQGSRGRRFSVRLGKLAILIGVGVWTNERLESLGKEAQAVWTGYGPK